MNILVLEDDPALCQGISLALNAPDRSFLLCETIAAAHSQLQKISPDAFIIDINLPDGSGLEFCRDLRASGNDAPILLLTANDTEVDIVIGFQSGADDYVTKPFSLAVLRARMDALLRRSGRGVRLQQDDTGFLFDFESILFARYGQPIELSKTEVRLLQILYTNAGRTLTREQLVKRIWSDGSEYVDENALSVAIRRLRTKLEDDPSKPQFIKTVHGIGYKWTDGR